MSNERKHRKVEIVVVYPRKEWVALRTKNQRLIFGYLVAKTNIKRKCIAFKTARQETLTIGEAIWNGVRVTNAELTKFLQHNTGIKNTAVRNTVLRTLAYLQKVGYIIVHKNQSWANQYNRERSIEILWDDKMPNYGFLTPRNLKMSNPDVTKMLPDVTSDVTKMLPDVTKVDFRCNTDVTKTLPDVTKVVQNVTSDNGTYGSTGLREGQNSGAYNTGIRNTENSATLQHGATVETSLAPQIKNEGEETDTPKSMIEGVSTIDHSDLHETFRYSMPENSRFDKPANLLSYWDTPGIGDNKAIRSYTLYLIRHVREKYNFDMAFIFTAENYRRLIHPELRLDKPLTFTEPTDEDYKHFVFDIEKFDKYFNSSMFSTAPDLRHQCIAYVRNAPRGIRWQYDSTAYWQPPLIPVALDYNSYMKSPATTESPFHRDASLSQLDYVVNYDQHDNTKFNYALKRQAFWLCATTAMTPESIQFLLPKFHFSLVGNPKSQDFKRYQACIGKDSFGKVNLINWFKDFALRYHFYDWFAERIRNSEGKYFLDWVGAECDSSEAVCGVIAYIPTAWGATREMFFTHAQYQMYEKMVPHMGKPAKIGQDVL